jgi:hypothetical protein
VKARGLFAAVIVVCWLVGWPAAAARADLPELAGTTVVEGSGDFFVDVHLSQAIRLQDVYKNQPEFATALPYVRVELRRFHASPPAFGPDTLAMEQFSTGRRQLHSGVSWSNSGRMPAGDYRMYLFAEGDARVTIHVADLAGARRFRPDRKATGAEVSILKPLAMPPGVSAFGGSGDLRTKGNMFFFGLFGGTEDHTADRSEFCTYEGGDEGAVSPYAPGCPQGFGVASMLPDVEGDWNVRGDYYNFPPGRYGIGHNMTHAGAAREPLFGMAAWLAYDDDAPVQAQGAPVVENLDPAAVAPPAPVPAALPAPPLARLASTRVRVVRGRARLRLACPAGGVACVGTAAIGRAQRRFRIAPGRARTVAVRVGRGRRATLDLRTGLMQQRFRVRLQR